jgi:hypothetical protein
VNKLKDRPCKDCKRKYPPYVMDFDHVKGRKAFAIGDGLRTGKSFEKIVAEIKKCELVCSNCHRIRTHTRRQKGYAIKRTT